MQPGSPRLIDTAGPDPATPPGQVRLVVGVIVGPFGVRGEAKLKLSTDDPEHLATVPRVWVGDEPRPRKLLGVRLHKGQALLRLQGISTPEQVDQLRGAPVRIAGSDARPLEPGEFYLYQLIGLRAVDEAGAEVGIVADIMETGANDVLVIAPAGGGPDLLLPNHPQFVPEIDPPGGRIVVRPIRFDD
ncbi:MAG: ribosome maturation factor RimM [Chloroflexota bacterium]